MNETTGKGKHGRVLSPSMFPGWIGRYVSAMEGTRFPASFHALTGIFVLTVTVGRRARLQRDGYVLWPPMSILLLGHSGVGKSASLTLGRDMLSHVVQLDERPAFILEHALEYTPSSLIQEWRDKQEDLALSYLEGAVTANELKAILKERTGNENASQFLIEACEHRDLTSKTVSRGTRTVKGVTVAFAFCSSLPYLRQSLTADEFGGGLMHRFLIAHEVKKAPIESASPDPETLARLAAELRDIWQGSPEEMVLGKDGVAALRRCRDRGEDRKYTNGHLSGYWNRYDAIVAKIALAFALADEVKVISAAHVDGAAEFLDDFLYPPMEALVHELSHGQRERRLIDLADDLSLSGETGVPRGEFLRRLPGTTMRARHEALSLMEELGLARGTSTTVYRR